MPDRVERYAFGDRLDVREGDVRERARRADRDRARHVRHAVVDDALDRVHRLVVRRRPRGLRAAALVDGDVDEDRAFLHLTEHVSGNELRGERSRDENRTDDEVGLLQRLLDLEARRHEERDPTAQHLFEMRHAVDRALEDRHPRAQSERDQRAVVADHPAPDDEDVPRRDTRDAGEQ